MNNDMLYIKGVFEKYPEKITVVDIETSITDSAREGKERPAYLKIAVPDGIVKNIRGTSDRRDRYFLVIIPNEVKNREESRIILPGDIIK